MRDTGNHERGGGTLGTEASSARGSSPATAPPAVVIDDLQLRFGDLVALEVDRLAIPSGALTAVIGPNGSGKSTLLRAISGLHDPAAGSIRVHGDPPGRHHVAHVLQTTTVNTSLPVTVAEVIRMARYRDRGLFGRLTDDDQRAVADAMARTDVTEFATRHLDELSGGQRQRVHLAQGLAQEADTVLLDEPVSGLDVTSLDRVAEILRQETDRGRTVVLTTHELHAAQAADHVVLLAGRVVASGTPDEVLTPDHLSDAYGGHLHELPGGELVVDQPDPH